MSTFIRPTVQFARNPFGSSHHHRGDDFKSNLRHEIRSFNHSMILLDVENRQRCRLFKKGCTPNAIAVFVLWTFLILISAIIGFIVPTYRSERIINNVYNDIPSLSIIPEVIVEVPVASPAFPPIQLPRVPIPPLPVRGVGGIPGVRPPIVAQNIPDSESSCFTSFPASCENKWAILPISLIGAPHNYKYKECGAVCVGPRGLLAVGICECTFKPAHVVVI